MRLDWNLPSKSNRAQPLTPNFGKRGHTRLASPLALANEIMRLTHLRDGLTFFFFLEKKCAQYMSIRNTICNCKCIAYAIIFVCTVV